MLLCVRNWKGTSLKRFLTVTFCKIHIEVTMYRFSCVCLCVRQGWVVYESLNYAIDAFSISKCI